MESLENREFEIIVRGKREYKAYYATAEQIAQIENSITEECSPYLGKLMELTDDEFLAFLNDKAMRWDVDRGLIPSQVPHLLFRYSEAFKTFEDQLWDEINLRLDQTGEDF